MKDLRELPSIYHVALKIMTLHVENKTETLKEIFYLIRVMFGFVYTDEEFIEKFRIIRKETFFDDGWGETYTKNNLQSYIDNEKIFRI